MKAKSLAALGAAFAVGLAAGAAPVDAAFGYCSQPRAPTTYLSKPNKPFCAASRSCSEWQVQMYRNEIDSYFGDLKRYAREVDDFYTDAGRYIECMSELD